MIRRVTSRTTVAGDQHDANIQLETVANNQSDDQTDNVIPPSQQPVQIPDSANRLTRRSSGFSWISTFIDTVNPHRNRQYAHHRILPNGVQAIQAEITLLIDLLETKRKSRESGGIWDCTREIEVVRRGVEREREKLDSLYAQLDDIVGVRLGSSWCLCARTRLEALQGKVRLQRELNAAEVKLQKINKELQEAKKRSWWRISTTRVTVLEKRNLEASIRLWELEQKRARHDSRLRLILML
ncbi:hypothetical protein E0Z10_g5589 [Xylaria hypoxylon]|uniref:Uncharacterized protein n=1 Tax=Xylaria hypoxylon TaxID=37992 RepID=A0A4Z0YIB9_9PEZI|nr:hypothetical protein E0Z10_g5589 [Xylaria hypoxylon]